MMMFRLIRRALGSGKLTTLSGSAAEG
jgi:hypothetical protein